MDTTDDTKVATKPTLVFKRVLGTGTYGTVHKARLGPRSVAVKTFRLPYAMNHKKIDNEIRLLKTLKDRHVIQYYAHKHAQDVVFLVTDFAEGGNLKQAIESKKLKSWSERSRIAREVAEGLAYIHDRGVVHRDLKSANVLLTALMEVKLCDFGMAVVKEQSGVHSTNSHIETPRWMPPELFDRRTSRTYESDIYALGTVMWEIAAMNTNPFERTKSNMDVADTVQNDQIEEIPRDTPREYRQQIVCCLSTLPSKRPTAAAVAAALKTQSQQQPMDGGSASTASVEIVPRGLTDASTAIPLPMLPPPLTFTPTAPSSVEPIVPKLFWRNSSDPVPWLRRSAKQGNVMAQYELAILYHVGRGVPMSKRRAVKWFRRAAEQGHPGAQFYLGMLFDIGQGVPKSMLTAFNWYSKAAEQGHSCAQFSLGCLLQEGEKTILQDKKLAVEWFVKAAEQNHPTALYRLEVLQGVLGVGTGANQTGQDPNRFRDCAVQTSPMTTPKSLPNGQANPTRPMSEDFDTAIARANQWMACH
ncbi:hypothetical protein BGZ73_008265 [Actinomortierella ambigua]|nr:hypothetical protein BGZ73_008265 [Actinomortierella ambigua]